MLIPFSRKFSEQERDTDLESRLSAERDGILAWMVEGCLDWQRIGLAPSSRVRRESNTYRKASDLFGEFLDDETITDPAQRVPQGTLYFEWEQWCERNNTKPGSKPSFTRNLEERPEYGIAKSNGTRYYTGLALRKAVNGTPKGQGH